MLRPFRVSNPDSLEDACAFRAESGPDAAVYAGGTELLLAIKEELLAPASLVRPPPAAPSSRSRNDLPIYGRLESLARAVIARRSEGLVDEFTENIRAGFDEEGGTGPSSTADPTLHRAAPKPQR